MTEAEFIPTLTHATERDIDLLLVEEVHASRTFAEWLAGEAGISAEFGDWNVKHSKRRTRSRREIDIFVEFDHPGTGQSALLIENKIDANEQPDQAESYREELAVLSEGDVHAAMLLVCPESYALAQSVFAGKFDAVVTYEQIADFLRAQTAEAHPELSRRKLFRADLLDQAIHKHRRGYQPVLNTVIGDFNAQYVALLAELAPDIMPGKSMLRPSNPDNSRSMIFDQDASLAELDPGIRPRRFAHELQPGSKSSPYVAVTFPGWGVAISELQAEMERAASSLGNVAVSAKPPTKDRPNPGLVLQVATDPVDNKGEFDAQIDAVSDGILVASRLRDWLISNTELLAQWCGLVDDFRGMR